MIAPRRGPAHGGRPATVWGLALRLNRGQIISWLIAFAGLGVIFGFLAGPVSDILGQGSALIAAAGGADPLFGFIVQILQIVALIAAVSGVQIAMRVYAEETEYRVEPLLATALSRWRYLASNAVLAFGAPALGLLLTGTVLGLVVADGDYGVAAGDVIAQATATIPAVWLLITLALAAIGTNP